jgi:hypothetical protein
MPSIGYPNSQRSSMGIIPHAQKSFGLIPSNMPKSQKPVSLKKPVKKQNIDEMLEKVTAKFEKGV